MRTAHSLTISWGGGGGGVMHGRGGHAWQGDMYGRGCMAGGVHGRGCVWQGLCVAGGYVWQGDMHATHAPMDRMTDMCKNITLPQTSFAGGNNRVNL